MELIGRISAWIRQKVDEASAEGVVVGLSGGVDSATVAALSKRAVGVEHVLGLIMPCHSQPQDEADAHLVAEALGLRVERVDLTPVYDALVAALPPGSDLARGNLKPRLRMTTLYYFANNLHYLVAGTGNKSELMVGYFTKYGDGGVDILPLGGVLKTQVWEMARALGVPEPIVTKTPTGGLWAGQTDEREMGITYRELDQAIRLIESGMGDEQDMTIEKVRTMMRSSAHKRVLAPICEV